MDSKLRQPTNFRSMLDKRKTPAKNRPTQNRTEQKISAGQSLPDNVLYTIFCFVPDFPKLSLVCKSWNALVKDNSLWKQLYDRKYKQAPKGPNPNYRELLFNKTMRERKTSLKRIANTICGSELNTKKPLKSFLSLLNLDLASKNNTKHVSGLSFTFSNTHGMKSYGSFLFSDKSISLIGNSITFYSSSPTCEVNIHNITELSVSFRSKSVDTYVDHNALAMKKIIWESFRQTDKMMRFFQTHNESCSVVFGVYEDGTVVCVFICVNFECFVRSFVESVPMCLPTHKPYFDDIDTQFGLHSYHIDLCIHSLHSKQWNHNFKEVFFDKPHTGQLEVSKTIKDKWPIKFLPLTFRLEAFEHKIEKITFLQWNVFDEMNERIWSGDRLVELVDCEVEYDFNRSEGKYTKLSVSDEKGRIFFEAKQSHDEYIFLQVEIALSLTLINSWFGTMYGMEIKSK